MLKGESLRVLVLIAIIFSSSVFACIPCDKEASVIVSHQVLPNFTNSYNSSELSGTVKFDITVDGHGNVESVEIIGLLPMGVPKGPILEMIKKSKYTTIADVVEHANCGVKNYPLSLDFPLPQKLNLDFEIKPIKST